MGSCRKCISSDHDQSVTLCSDWGGIGSSQENRVQRSCKPASIMLVHRTSFCRFQTPSLCVNSSCMVRHLGRMRHSKPHMLKSKLGLSLLYTDTKLLSQLMVVTDRGRRFLMSQNTARPLTDTTTQHAYKQTPLSRVHVHTHSTLHGSGLLDLLRNTC